MERTLFLWTIISNCRILIISNCRRIGEGMEIACLGSSFSLGISRFFHQGLWVARRLSNRLPLGTRRMGTAFSCFLSSSPEFDALSWPGFPRDGEDEGGRSLLSVATSIVSSQCFSSREMEFAPLTFRRLLIGFPAAPAFFGGFRLTET